MTDTRASLVYRNLTADLAEQCADLELRSFPSADPDELLGADDIAAYAETFPEGFFVCLDGDRVVGQGAGILLDFDFANYQHTIAEITGEHQCGNHDPAGDWYYGTDIVVDPAYRRRGIGAELYRLRKDLVRRLGKKGIIAGGYMVGYPSHKAAMTPEDYVSAVRRREIYDPTLTFQMDNGFELLGVLKDYLPSEETDGWSALIVWSSDPPTPP
ncbi:MAG: GNAT family N-acetyltransferase [Armatimonadetes bacterium]|nr:MAG: GNAT family N-acetyltransferase [Armatimonadota bacterium]